MATSFHDNQLIERFLMVSAEYLGTKYAPPRRAVCSHSVPSPHQFLSIVSVEIVQRDKTKGVNNTPKRWLQIKGAPFRTRFLFPAAVKSACLMKKLIFQDILLITSTIFDAELMLAISSEETL